MYKKVSNNMDFCSRELDIIKFWKEKKIFEQSLKKNEGKENFSFFDGPPTANGKPHIGHILTRVMKDIIPRYKSMKGYDVLRKAGWDTHGLPVELEVEKLLGIDGKQDIERFGIEPFIQQCKESVWKYQGEWERMSERVGFWVDMEDPYITYSDDYIESVWWAIKTIADKNLVYKGHKIVPYCPRCGTSLSSHEVAQGYKDITETSIVCRFKLVNEENTSFLAWTTTPWTLPSNVALCVNPKEEYSKVKVGEEYYILAKALIEKHFEEGSFEIIDTKLGKEYEYAYYKPLFDFVPADDKLFYVTCDSYVTLTDGTGIVHQAPAFGEDDARVGRKYDITFVQLVDDRGRFTVETRDLEGVFVKDGDALVMDKLDTAGLLFSKIKFTHSYPFCWRCDTPLLYYARSSWFIAMSKLKDKLLKNNNSVNWMPATIGTGRMGNFLENVIDWGFSRERYWGTPLPIWVCAECGEVKVIGSRAELEDLTGCANDIELHRPYLDKLTMKCGKCSCDMHRTPEVLDCWFDSGAMPFAQFHYPFENKEKFYNRFPADFISEAVDQTRGWFYTLLAISTALFDKSPFKNCIVLGHVTDKDGIKMSKHKGNVVDPWSALDKQGADAVRWYFYTSSMPWLPSKFSADNVSEGQRKFLGTLWNTYAFYVLYADIDKFNPTEYKLEDIELSVMDKWVLSGLNSLIEFVDKGLNDYKITECARKIGQFTDDLSNWYVRRCRERYWSSDMTEDKKAAYMTLYTVLSEMTKLIAPFVPFIAEEMYQNLVANFDSSAPQSVHLCEFPVAVSSFIDKNLEVDMNSVLSVVVLARSCRNTANIKNRQPLATMYIKGDITLNEDMRAIIAEEINVKEIKIVDSDREFISYELKPQLKTIGPKYGKLLGAIRDYLADCPAVEIVDTVESGKVFSVSLSGSVVDFTKEDLLIKPISKQGCVAEQDNKMTVILDTNLTPELVIEGMEREIVSKVQTMRKEAGLEVVDHIVLGYMSDDTISNIIINSKSIALDTLSDKVINKIDGFTKEWSINGSDVTLSVRKI